MDNFALAFTFILDKSNKKNSESNSVKREKKVINKRSRVTVEEKRLKLAVELVRTGGSEDCS